MCLRESEIGEKNVPGSASAETETRLGREIVEADHGRTATLELPLRRQKKIEKRKPAFHHHFEQDRVEKLEK